MKPKNKKATYKIRCAKCGIDLHIVSNHTENIYCEDCYFTWSEKKGVYINNIE